MSAHTPLDGATADLYVTFARLTDALLSDDDDAYTSVLPIARQFRVDRRSVLDAGGTVVMHGRQLHVEPPE